MKIMYSFIQVSTTVEKKEDAKRLAELALNQRLAACVQVIGPITSTYWWQGKMEKAQEWLCLMKTGKDLYEALERAIKSIHPYDEPEIIALPIVGGSQGYLCWIDEQTTKTGNQ
jgi:periplasmic divalent cation tolerance protein